MKMGSMGRSSCHVAVYFDLPDCIILAGHGKGRGFVREHPPDYTPLLAALQPFPKKSAKKIPRESAGKGRISGIFQTALFREKSRQPRSHAEKRLVENSVENVDNNWDWPVTTVSFFEIFYVFFPRSLGKKRESAGDAAEDLWKKTG
ncbi:MAG: hypothetical protein IJU29_03290 [Oscillospiraceae bacterium]|nr:hypothetical protein [Oscillospiraceae bacterium]